MCSQNVEVSRARPNIFQKDCIQHQLFLPPYTSPICNLPCIYRECRENLQVSGARENLLCVVFQHHPVLTQPNTTIEVLPRYSSTTLYSHNHRSITKVFQHHPVQLTQPNTTVQVTRKIDLIVQLLEKKYPITNKQTTICTIILIALPTE